jgi:hypothetical protein
MSNVDAGPQGDFVGPEENITRAELGENSSQTDTFQIQVTNVPYFGSGEGTAYLGLTTGTFSGGYCYLTSDPTAAVSFTGWKDGGNRRFIATPNGWLSYSGATPYYVGSWRNISNDYQTWIADGTLYLHNGVMCFYSDGSNTWLYNQSEGTVGYTTCQVVPQNAP